MKFYHQLNRHDPEAGLWGDCFRTVIGCLVNVHPSYVPHWFDHDQTSEAGYAACNEWLQQRDLMLYRTAHAGERDQIMSNMMELNPGQFYLLFGLSRDGNGHVVICQDDKVIHDPSWTGQSVVMPYEQGYWIVGTLVSKVMSA